MKVLLINPNRYHYKGAKGPRITLPLGLMYIAAFLEKHSVDVNILDCLVSQYTEIIHKETAIIHGLSEKHFIDIVSDINPDIVGIGFPFTAQFEGAIQAAKLVKRVNPNIIVVAGGPHVSVDGTNLISNYPEIAYGVRGEGEVAMLRIVDAISRQASLDRIPGLIYRSGYEVKSNPPELILDLDSLPWPAYHLIDLERFFKYGEKISGRRIKGHTRSISMITSRGCPFNCIFCSINLHMGKKFRYNSPKYVFDHIQNVIEKIGVTHIAFEDDNLTLKPERCYEFFAKIVKEKLRFKWNTPNGIRADYLNEDLLQLMKEAGCVALTIAPESGSQNTLDTIINKKLDLKTVIPIAKICKDLEIPLNSYFVIGLPGETKTTMKETVDFAQMLYDNFNVMPSIFSATPLMGTKLYDIVIENGYLAKNMNPQNLMLATQAEKGEPMIQTPEFTPEDVKEIAGQLDLNRRTSYCEKGKRTKIANSKLVLHIVPYSFPLPQHKYLGSTKDIFGRIEYFDDRNIKSDILAPNTREDISLLPELLKLKLNNYKAVLIEKADYPLSMLYIKEKAPHTKILLRGHNAEFYHHLHRVIARVKDNWHDSMATHFKENMWDIETAIRWGGRDYICGQIADAVLSITDWERQNYWNLFLDNKKVFTVPSFLPKEFLSEANNNRKRNLCVCYMSNGINPMLQDSCRQFNNLVEAIQYKYKDWDFAITGDPERMGGGISNRITKLGMLKNPFSALKEARCIVILSDFGFGFKTKILDAVYYKCWTIVTNGLYNYLPEIIRPYCIRLAECSPEEFKKALRHSQNDFPEGDPNLKLRESAFQALDHIFDNCDSKRIYNNTSKNEKYANNPDMANAFSKTLKALSGEHEILNHCRIRNIVIRRAKKSSIRIAKLDYYKYAAAKDLISKNSIGFKNLLILFWISILQKNQQFISLIMTKLVNKHHNVR
jgi:anaerobic magnesium-protoporphyrin IX monomethyl ester cyclase